MEIRPEPESSKLRADLRKTCEAAEYRAKNEANRNWCVHEPPQAQSFHNFIAYIHWEWGSATAVSVIICGVSYFRLYQQTTPWQWKSKLWKTCKVSTENACGVHCHWMYWCGSRVNEVTNIHSVRFHRSMIKSRLLLTKCQCFRKVQSREM